MIENGWGFYIVAHSVPLILSITIKQREAALEDRVGVFRTSTVVPTGDSRKLSRVLGLENSSTPPAVGPAESKGPSRKVSSAPQEWQDPR